MSFLKIKGPSKRDKLVAENSKTKNKIQNDFRSERLGEQSLYEDFGKIFKPITEQQQKSSEEIVSKFAPLREAIENMPAQQALPWELELRGVQNFLPSKIGEQPEISVAPELDTPQIELELLMASKQAGNIFVRNELVSICDELLRQKFCLMMLTKT